MYKNYKAIVEAALSEDIGSGDLTTSAVIPPAAEAEGGRRHIRVRAKIFAKSSGVVAGLEVARTAFKLLDKRLKFVPAVKDGMEVKPFQSIAIIEGDAKAILMAERTALNFLQLLGGVATKARQFVKLVRNYKVKILDTRKTIPNLRALQKYAVRVGGACNHRFGLFDGILIKDNHIKTVGSLYKAVKLARANAPKGMKIEVEVKNIAQLKEALEAGADIVLLDNMDLKAIRRAVKLAKGRAKLEASGGINLDNLVKVAGCGVDFISIGALTHSITPMDISLEVIEVLK